VVTVAQSQDPRACGPIFRDNAFDENLRTQIEVTDRVTLDRLVNALSQMFEYEVSRPLKDENFEIFGPKSFGKKSKLE
jgi:hypothetical protein